VEGTSKRAHTTKYSRGTPGYRAPELVEEVIVNKYTNKVDIWAIGCILYEIVFQRKAFSSDFEVSRYSDTVKTTGKLLGLPFETDAIFDDSRKYFLSKIIHEMVDIDPTRRPGAEHLYKRFIPWASDETKPLNPIEKSQSIESDEHAVSPMTDVITYMNARDAVVLPNRDDPPLMPTLGQRIPHPEHDSLPQTSSSGESSSSFVYGSRWRSLANQSRRDSDTASQSSVPPGQVPIRMGPSQVPEPAEPTRTSFTTSSVVPDDCIHDI